MKTTKINVGIIGGTGYTGGELIRILLNHPYVSIESIYSRSKGGALIHSVHDDLMESDLKFTDKIELGLDVYFLCLPHGETTPFLKKHPKLTKSKIIDLSNDFRLKKRGNKFQYGLPELNRAQLHGQQLIANPGCFATAIQLALLPLAEDQLLTDDIHVSAITGSTGAGNKLLPTTHFSWRNNNASVYKAFEHQHLGEIGQSLNQLQKEKSPRINFIPYRGDFSRGIIASCYTKCNLSLTKVKKLYKSFYKDHNFTHVVDDMVHLKQVVNTNKCYLNISKNGDRILIVSVIDNLIKGASGQAVQNLNLMFGWTEDTALHLKASLF